MSKPLAGVSLALPIIAIGLLSVSVPKVVAILLTIAFVATGLLQLLIALLTLFALTGIAA